MPKKPHATRGEDVVTVLAPDTSLSGSLSFDTSLMIRGSFEGDIDAKGVLYVQEGASVNAGKIRASNIYVAGTVRGDLEAVDRIELKPSAKVYGNVRSSKLRIADGVIFEGRCEMLRSAEAFDPFAERREEGAPESR